MGFNKIVSTLLYIIFLIYKTNAQVYYRGCVRDSVSLEPLIGATVRYGQAGTSTDVNGNFILKVTTPIGSIEVSYVGYETKSIELNENQSVQVLLAPSAQINEVVITGRALKYDPISSKVTLNSSLLSSLPAMGGEKDLMKSLYVLPGVAGANEGSASLIARGGNTDQNLFPIDGANLYNTGHFFNLVSVYNTDAVKKVDFYNGNYPARYGQSLSSVVDVTLREGNKSKKEGLLDIGILSSRLLLEGPLDSNKESSYIISMRSSYLDLLKVYQLDRYNKKQNENYFGFTFFDISGKLNFEPSADRKYFISGYWGTDYNRDFYRYGEETKKYTIINNGALSIKGIQHLNNRLALDEGIHFTFNTYKNKGKDPDYFNKLYFSQSNKLFDLQVKANATWQAKPNHEIITGISITGKIIAPFNFRLENYEYKEPLLSSIETSVYLEDKYNINPKLLLNSGLRTTLYTQNKFWHSSIEPRLTLTHFLSSNHSINLSLNKNTQYIHALIRNEGFKEHVIWVSSTQLVKPQEGYQVSSTFTGTRPKIRLNYSISVYYREMKNLIWFPFTDQTASETEKFPYANWETKTLSNGKGKAYGIEIFLSKQFQKTTVMVSYTYSKSLRRYDNMNNGNYFNSSFDRPHQLTVSTEHYFSKKFKLAALWEFRSGLPLNLPSSMVANTPFSDSYALYNGFNKYRLPNYHRLDISFTYTKPYPDGSSLMYNFSIYNAYNKFNPYGVEIEETDTESTNVRFKAVSVFPVIPSFNIIYKF